MRLLFAGLLMLTLTLPTFAQEQPIEVTCDDTHAADYSAFLRQASDALDSAVANGTDPDLAIANTEGVLSIILNLLASCDGLYFSSFAYRAEPGETVEIGPISLRRGAYRVIADGDMDVTFRLTPVTDENNCSMDETATLTADDIRLGLYAIVVVDEACEAVLSMSSEAEEYSLFLNYIPRQPLIIDN